MSVVDHVLPWRRGRLQRQWLVAETQAARDSTASSLREMRQDIQERLEELRETQKSLQAANVATVETVQSEIVSVLHRSIRDLAAQISFSTHDLLEQLNEYRVAINDNLAKTVQTLLPRIQALEADIAATQGLLRSSTSDLAEGLRKHANEVRAATTDHLAQTSQDLSARLQRLEAEIPSLPQLVRSSLDEFLALLSTNLQALQIPGERISDQVTSSLAQSLVAFDAVNRGRAENLQQWIEKISVETSNGLIHVDTSLHSRLNTLENQLLPQLGEQIHEIAAMQMAQAAERADRSVWRPDPGERYHPARAEPFDTILAHAERDFPNVYGAWHERLETMRAAFDLTRVGNAAHGSDRYSRMFRSFVETHASGRVLDVGCGPFGRPYYLAAYPAELVAGLEPLTQRELPDFEAVRGISEYLPWPDGSFSTVVSATSLDHCLSLDRSLAEMRRVLRPGGTILLWIGSIVGAAPFRPDEPSFVPADKFHLFHFDVAWFEPILAIDFEISNRAEMQRAGYSHVFYALKLKALPMTLS